MNIHFRLHIVSAFLITLGFLASVNNSYAQTDKALVDLADEMYAFGDYEDALDIYIQAIGENPNNVRANLMAGQALLITTSRKKESVQYLIKAHELDPEAANNIFFLIAEGYRFGLQFDKAIEFYNKFLDELKSNGKAFANDDIESLTKRTERRIEECTNAKDLTKFPRKITLENVSSVNSEFDDYGPAMSHNEDMLIFTSRRDGSTGGLKDVDNKFFEDIYMARKEGSSWARPINIGPPINTNTHESGIGLSPSGDKLYIYVTEGNGDIYFSEVKKGKWTSPKSVGKTINSPSKETSAFETSDGKLFFFSSDRPGGKGKFDLYMCKKGKKDEWADPVLLGDEINTAYDEESPFFDVKTQSLYFSSKGHNGMGGYDIYKSTLDTTTGAWSKPLNMGYPINSADDDLYLLVGADGKTAYYSSFKDDSKGGNDIYKIYPIDEYIVDSSAAEKAVAAVDSTTSDSTATLASTENLDGQAQPSTPEASKVETFTGTIPFHLIINDFETGQPITSEASIQILVRSNNAQIVNNTAQNGNYTHTFEDPSHGLHYIILVESKGYLFQSIQLDLPQSASSPVEKIVALKKPKLREANVLRNIYFEFDQYTIRQDSQGDLSKLEKFLKDNPNARIEISGHTDNLGSEQYNLQLSQKRANSVAQSLIAKGIDPSRVVPKGYGKSRPIASNDDEEEGREINRRTEFVILKN